DAGQSHRRSVDQHGSPRDGESTLRDAALRGATMERRTIAGEPDRATAVGVRTLETGARATAWRRATAASGRSARDRAKPGGAAVAQPARRGPKGSLAVAARGTGLAELSGSSASGGLRRPDAHALLLGRPRSRTRHQQGRQRATTQAADRVVLGLDATSAAE